MQKAATKTMLKIPAKNTPAIATWYTVISILYDGLLKIGLGKRLGIVVDGDLQYWNSLVPL